VAVLQKGGNAVDAAVAVGFAMAVTHPYAGNLGGGGYMLIRMADGRMTFIDFRERAPEKASRNMFLDAKGELTRDSVEGWRSSGVPGTVRGFEIAVSKYGRRKWAENMAPAVELASKGFPVSYALAESLKGSKSLASAPESKRIFQKDGAFYDVGETLAQPELAQTLERISKNGPNEFYEGDTAKRFADEMAKHGGLITVSDLKNYKAIERTPLTGKYKNYTIITSPPSSSGGIALLEMFGILDGTGYERDGVGFAGTKGFVGGFGRGMLTAFGEPEVKAFVKASIDEALKLERAMAQLRAPKRVVVLHYSPIAATVVGEAPEIHAYLGSSRLGEVIDRNGADLVVHGHAHHDHGEGAHGHSHGLIDRSIVPVKDQNGIELLAHDELMRPTTTMQTLAALEPSFKMQGEMMPGFDAVAQQRYPEVEKINHVHHAGNSSGIVDGAAAILIGTREFGEKANVPDPDRLRVL
jgi:hypothetical protein